ncbi:ankyrin repeat domain-containing protein [Legionella waltersii]|uniref:Ankyrin repeats (3 copies) n=1 Tax=Legionella waltersii TaxID=66969 RepID=A0A0W1A0T4_9GAMM|nr:ankyrin repeat domain-containing protein [Legionella waltersii]KTD74938.1 Ankyrin repeats (3 copies) [Legionella waltersii]SNV08622.1 Ankyrin repeats (3 copies) [Legionella waltersii]
MPRFPQKNLIKKAIQWQSRFLGETASLNTEEMNEGLCLGLSVWRLYCTLTGKYDEYEKLLKLIDESEPESGDLSAETHKAYETVIQNSLWLHRLLAVESGAIQDRMAGALEALFKRQGEPFPLTYHHHFSGVLTVEEIKATLVNYLTTDPKVQKGVGFTLSIHNHAISMTRVGNLIEVVDPETGVVIPIEIPQKDTPQESAAELTKIVNDLFEKVLSDALNFDDPNYEGTYHEVRMHVYSRLQDPKTRPTIYPSTSEQLKAIYSKRTDTLGEQDKHTNSTALSQAVQNGDKELVRYLEATLGPDKLEACKPRAFKAAVSSGKIGFVERYYKKEFVDKNTLIKAFYRGDLNVIHFLLEKGHRFETEAFNYLLAQAAKEDQGYTFSLLLEYYDKYNNNPTQLTNPIHVKVQQKKSDGPMPLMNIAARYNSVEVMRLLIARGVDLAQTDDFGKNCLHYLSTQQVDLFAQIAMKNPDLLTPDKGKVAEQPFYRVLKAGGKLSERLFPLLAQKGKWYEAYLIALMLNNQVMIKKCQENISFADMLTRDINSKKSMGVFIELCKTQELPDQRIHPFIQALSGLNYSEQEANTLHHIYLLALANNKLDIITNVLKTGKMNPNALFLESPHLHINPGVLLSQNSSAFELVAKNVDMTQLSQEQLVDFYLIALRYKQTDLCVAINKHIKDKNTLFAESQRCHIDPNQLFAKDGALFNQMIGHINLADLKPEALNQVYKLGLLHNHQNSYRKCILLLKENSLYLSRTDDLDLCYENKNTALFKELFLAKNAGEEWCKKMFIKALRDDNYEVADAILGKYPEIVNAEVDTIRGTPLPPLRVAIVEKNVERCKFLLSHHANPYTKWGLSQTLMKEGQLVAELKPLFDSYEKNIAQMQGEFSAVFDQLVAFKKWNLTKKYGIFGDYENVITLNMNGKKIVLPREVKEILAVMQKSEGEVRIPVLKSLIMDMSATIESMPDKVLPAALKSTLKTTINSSNAQLAAIESSKFSPDPFVFTSYKETLKQVKPSAENRNDSALGASI